MLIPVSSFGSIFQSLVDLFKYDLWYVVVLHRFVENFRWSVSDDLVSLMLLFVVDGNKLV